MGDNDQTITIPDTVRSVKLVIEHEDGTIGELTADGFTRGVTVKITEDA